MKIKNTKKAPAEKVVAKKVAKPAAAKAPKACAKKAVTFTVHADNDKAVYVAGEFNGWDPAAKRMVDKDGSGLYSAVLALAPGEYEYKFVINGIWCVDPNCREWRQNSLGTLNSVLRV